MKRFTKFIHRTTNHNTLIASFVRILSTDTHPLRICPYNCYAHLSSSQFFLRVEILVDVNIDILSHFGVALAALINTPSFQVFLDEAQLICLEDRITTFIEDEKDQNEAYFIRLVCILLRDGGRRRSMFDRLNNRLRWTSIGAGGIDGSVGLHIPGRDVAILVGKPEIG